MKQDDPSFRREAIAELLQSSGLSATAFAGRANVAKSLIGAWLSGLVTPQVGTLTRLCREFKVPIQFFFTDWEPEQDGLERAREVDPGSPSLGRRAEACAPGRKAQEHGKR